jgi:transketolase
MTQTGISSPALRPAVAGRDAFGQALLEIGRENPNLVVLDADLGTATRASMFASEFPERFIQVGIAEQNMIGIAAGLALAGWIPVTSTFACFASNRVLDQVRTSVAQPRLNVKIAGAYSGILAGKTGITHQSVEDLALFRAVPQMTVLAPSDGTETHAAVRAAVEYHGPVYIRLTRDAFRTVMPPDYVFRIGKAVPMPIPGTAETPTDGHDVALLTTGWMLVPALEAASALAQEGIRALVLHLPTVKPLDVDAVVAAARETGAVVTVEDHSVIGGLGAAVAEALAERRPTLMRRVGICDCYTESAPNEDLLLKYGLTPQNIAAKARELLEARGDRT